MARETAKLILGIDPGFSGALAILDLELHQPAAIADMPLSKATGKNQIDLKGLADFLGPWADQIRFCILENVSAMTYIDKHGEIRGQGAAASFEFGRSMGILQGMLAAFKIPVILSHPSSWKSALGLSSNKKDSLALVNKLFPSYHFYFLRQKDDGRAEALLLAVFASRYINQG